MAQFNRKQIAQIIEIVRGEIDNYIPGAEDATPISDYADHVTIVADLREEVRSLTKRLRNAEDERDVARLQRDEAYERIVRLDSDNEALTGMLNNREEAVHTARQAEDNYYERYCLAAARAEVATARVAEMERVARNARKFHLDFCDRLVEDVRFGITRSDIDSIQSLCAFNVDRDYKQTELDTVHSRLRTLMDDWNDDECINWAHQAADVIERLLANQAEEK